MLLSAIALHRIGLGLALIFVFSIGLAATITAIGLVAVFARRTFGRLSLDGPVVRALPAVSAALILAVGLVITARALPGVARGPTWVRSTCGWGPAHGAARPSRHHRTFGYGERRAEPAAWRMPSRTHS